MRRCHTATVILTVLGVTSGAWGWGATGHEIVARIAEHRLQSHARTEVCRLLGENVELAEIAVWADQIRPERPETAPWHYVNIATGGSTFERERDCPQGACVVGAVERFAGELADPTFPDQRRAAALRFLVHFVGDLHQPLHCYTPGRGGNDIQVLCADRPYNLHEIWDSVLIDRQGLTSAQYAAELMVDIDEADVAAWVRGDPADWAIESWLLAMRCAALTPQGRPVVTGDALGRLYMDGATVVVDQQLTRAGVRLAFMINTALRRSPRSRPAPGALTAERAQPPGSRPSAATSAPSP